MAGRGRGAALALALLLGACRTNEPDTRPFHVRVTVAGEPLQALVTADGVVELRSATANRQSPTSLTLAQATLDGTAVQNVEIAFDPAALPDLQFPEYLAGAPVRIRVRVAGSLRGPTQEPLPIPGIRVMTEFPTETTPVSRFMIWEGTYGLEDETVARIFAPAGPTVGEVGDFPYCAVEGQWLELEPGECGLVFYDSLVVQSDNPDDQQFTVTLRRGEREVAFLVDADLPAWTVVHVESWHRDRPCSDQSRVWTQLAAWRSQQ